MHTAASCTPPDEQGEAGRLSEAPKGGLADSVKEVALMGALAQDEVARPRDRRGSGSTDGARSACHEQAVAELNAL